jgi:hypothetical protein
VVTLYMATIRVYLHDVFLMLVRVEGDRGGEGGAIGQARGARDILTP